MSYTSLNFLGNATSYLSVPPTSLSFGTNDFTIEWWQYQTDTNPFPRVFSIGDLESSTTQIAVSIEDGTFYFWSFGSVKFNNSLPNIKNTWTHFAIVRQSGVITVYLNGNTLGNFNDTTNYSFTENLVIGNETVVENATSFGGQLYNFMWLIGTAKYTGPFTPSKNIPPNPGSYELILNGSYTGGSEGGNVTNNNVGSSSNIPGYIPPNYRRRVSSNSYGQFWFGGSTFPGFLYKKNTGTGARRSTKFAAGGNITCNSSTYLYNKYKPGGSGIGASSVATRRAKNRLATVCGANQCFPFYNNLGLNLNINYTLPTVPSAPVIISVTPFDTSLTIEFLQSSNGGSPIINYEYAFIDVSGGVVYIPFSPPVTTTPVFLTGLTRGTTYNLKIRAVNAVGPSIGSATITQTTLDVPSAPTNLTGIPGDESIQVLFTQGSDGGSSITNYEYSLNGGSSWISFSPAITSSPVTISGLTNGTIYDIKLRAINSVGNSDDSAQISIAPIPSNSFAPDYISGINLWLDGQYSSSIITSSDLVTQWNDKSGSNNDFIAGPSGTITYAEPSGINNRPAIYFETAPNTYLERTFNISPSNDLSLFMVVYHVSNIGGNSELFFTRSAPTSPSYAYFDLFSNTQTTGLLNINIGNQTQVSTGVDIRGTIALIDVIATSTTDIYVNGTQTNNNITRGSLLLNNDLGWAISGGTFKGYVGEVITYPSGVTDTERQQIEGYLAWKWGLQDNLPDSQPYKNAPPISLDAPVITSITGSSQSVSVDFTQTTGGLTITNYQYSTDNGATFRPLSTPDITSPLTISTLSSDGTTPLTGEVTYDIIIQAKTADGLSPVSNMVQGTPLAPTVTQLLTNPDFSLGTTGWSATGGFGTYSYTSSNQVAVLDGILYFTYVSRTVSQSVNVSSYILSANSFEGILNIRHREKSDDPTYTQIDTYNFTLLFKNSGGTTITTKTTGTTNAPQNFTDITLTLNRSEIPSTFDTITTVELQITGIDTGFWNGNHGPMVDYVNLNIN